MLDGVRHKIKYRLSKEYRREVVRKPLKVATHST